MEQQPTSLFKSALISGVFIGIILILVSVIFHISGLTLEKWTTYVSYLLFTLGIIWAQIRYRKSLGGEMSYGQALSVGLLAIVFASVLSSIYAYLQYKFIDPTLIDQMRLVAEQKLVEKGIPESQIDTAISIQSKILNPAILSISGIFGGTFVGFIISLITAIFTKKQSTNIEQ